MQQAKKDKQKYKRDLNRKNAIYNIYGKSTSTSSTDNDPYNSKSLNILNKHHNKNNILLTLLPLATLALLTTISFFSLSSSTTNADTSTSSTAKVNVAVACTLSGSTTTHAVEVLNGAYNDNITGTTLRTICNGSGNYNIYAVGYTNNTEGNNTLYSSTSGTIPTGTTLNGTTSNWAMKLANSTGNTATIENNYNTFQVVPSTSTLVASYNATTSNQTTDSTLQTTYGVSISPNQPAGTYTGAVKYTMNYTEYIPPLHMQSATSADCGQEMVDSRDGNSYTTATIGSLCWMTQNLMLGSDSTMALTQADSNVPSSGYTLPARGTYGTSVSGQYVWGNDTQCTSSSTTACAGYYSYATATAGTNPSSGAATNDICPYGWRLPTYTEYDTLMSSYNANYALFASPFFGVSAGRYSGNSFSNGGSYGYYWSSTAYDSDRAEALGISRNPYVGVNAKNYGNSIRCVAKL